MKKKYETPYIAVESFQLDAAIAGDCSDKGRYTIGHYDADSTCGAGDPELSKKEGVTHFYWGPSQCEIDVVNAGADDTDTLCYHAFLATKFLYS